MLCIAVKILLFSQAEYRWSSSGFVAQVFLRRLHKSGDLKTRFGGEPLEKFLRTMLSRNIHRAAVRRVFFFVVVVLAVGDIGRRAGHRKAFRIERRKCCGRKQWNKGRKMNFVECVSKISLQHAVTRSARGIFRRFHRLNSSSVRPRVFGT